MIAEWKTVKMELDAQVIRLLKQEDFCGTIALTCFVENCLDLHFQGISHLVSKNLHVTKGL